MLDITDKVGRSWYPWVRLVPDGFVGAISCPDANPSGVYCPHVHDSYTDAIICARGLRP